MPEVVAAAPAKINLALRVGGARADGYHPLNTLFHAVDLVERVTVRALGDALEAAGGPAGQACGQTPAGLADRVLVAGLDAAAVPLGPDNLALRAAALLRREAGRRGPGLGPLGPVEIGIVKRIPVAGGLAGGSADAAAALVALNELWDLGFGPDRLLSLAGELGSDVPFALVGGNAIGQGRGERLALAPAAGNLHWVLVTSPDGLSTAAVFEHFDHLRAPPPGAPPPPIPSGLLDGLRAGDPALVGANLVNDLAPAACGLRPELRKLQQTALDLGACGAIVSGSGPTVACLAPRAAAAGALAASLAQTLPELAAAGRILRATGPAPAARATHPAGPQPPQSPSAP
jgi:4-diphosphocytidyl-2-C-methyl-D-erythritol kinase